MMDELTAVLSMVPLSALFGGLVWWQRRPRFRFEMLPPLNIVDTSQEQSSSRLVFPAVVENQGAQLAKNAHLELVSVRGLKGIALCGRAIRWADQPAGDEEVHFRDIPGGGRREFNLASAEWRRTASPTLPYEWFLDLARWPGGTLLRPVISPGVYHVEVAIRGDNFRAPTFRYSVSLAKDAGLTVQAHRSRARALIARIGVPADVNSGTCDAQAIEA